jgi:DNA-binding NtrC family response regulator
LLRTEKQAPFGLQKKPAIFIAESDYALGRSLKEALVRGGFTVSESFEEPGFLRNVPKAAIDLVIIGGSWDGLDVARQFRTSDVSVPIIFIAKETSEDLAIAALRAGINDYFKQPCSFEDIVASVNRFVPQFLSRRHKEGVKEPASNIVEGHRMIGESLAMREIRETIGRISSTDSNVLVTGETGTGKELVAELIHKNSLRANQSFVCINCAAIPDSLLESELFGYERGSFTGAYSSSKGKLKSADGGTIFLDEIGDMSPYAQAKILRVIESREVQPLGRKENIPLKVRFIAATNKDLEQSVSEKTFRKDLYYRLNVAAIHLPPLKERKQDIPSLCNHYIGDLNRRFGRHIEAFTEDTAEILLRYHWPGNVRELKNLLEATVGNFKCPRDCSVNDSDGGCPEVNFRCRQISFTDLPEQFRRRFGNPKDLVLDERNPLLSILIGTNWNVSKAAQMLHWSRMTVYRKMAKYHIAREKNRSSAAKREKLPRENSV